MSECNAPKFSDNIDDWKVIQNDHINESEKFFSSNPTLQEVVILVKKLVSFMQTKAVDHKKLKICVTIFQKCIRHLENYDKILDPTTEWSLAYSIYFYFELNALIKEENWNMLEDSIHNMNSFLDIMATNHSHLTEKTIETLERIHTFLWHQVSLLTNKGTEFIDIKYSAPITLLALRILSLKSFTGFSNACVHSVRFYYTLDKKKNNINDVNEKFWRPCRDMLIASSNLHIGTDRNMEINCILTSALLNVISQLIHLDNWEFALEDFEVLCQFIATCDLKGLLHSLLTALRHDLSVLFNLTHNKSGSQLQARDTVYKECLNGLKPLNSDFFIKSIRNIIQCSFKVTCAAISSRCSKQSCSASILGQLQVVLFNYHSALSSLDCVLSGSSLECRCITLMIFINCVKTYLVFNSDLEDTTVAANLCIKPIDILLSHVKEVNGGKYACCSSTLSRLESCVGDIAGVLNNRSMNSTSIEMFNKLSQNNKVFRSLYGDNDSVWKNYRCLSCLYRKERKYMMALQSCVKGLVVDPSKVDQMFDCWIKVKLDILKKGEENYVLNMDACSLLKPVLNDLDSVSPFSDTQLLLYELMAYLKYKAVSFQSSIENVFSKLSSMDLLIEDELCALVLKCQWLWQLTRVKDDVSDNLFKTISVFKDKCKQSKSLLPAHKACLYEGILHYWNYMGDKQKLVIMIKKEMAIATIIPLKQITAAPGEEELENDTSIKNAYQCLRVSKEVELLTYLEKAILSWEDLTLESLSVKELAWVLSYASDAAYVVNCHNHHQLALRLWKWIKKSSFKRVEFMDIYVQSIKELSILEPSISLISDCQEMQTLLTDKILCLKLNIAMGYIHLYLGNLEEGMTVLKDLFNVSQCIDWNVDSYIVNSELYLLSSQYASVPGLNWDNHGMMNAGRKFFTTESKVMILSVFYQTDRIKDMKCSTYHHLLQLMMDISLQLGDICINLGAYQEALTYMKQEVILAQNNLFAQRAAHLTTKLLKLDLMCCNMKDASVKIHSLQHILKPEACKTSGKYMSRAKLKEMAVKESFTLNTEVEVLRTDDSIAGSPVPSPVAVFHAYRKKQPKQNISQTKPSSRASRARFSKSQSSISVTPIIPSNEPSDKCKTVKKKRLVIYEDKRCVSPVSEIIQEFSAFQIPDFLDHKKSCTCFICGNPRLLIIYFEIFSVVGRYYAMKREKQHSIDIFDLSLKMYQKYISMFPGTPQKIGLEIIYAYCDCMYWLVSIHGDCNVNNTLKCCKLLHKSEQHFWMAPHLNIRYLDLVMMNDSIQC